MTEENKETKVTFKEKFKKAFPWILGGIGTVGGSIVSYKLGKFVTKSKEEIQKDIVISEYLRNEVNNAEAGIESVIAVMDTNNKETFAKLEIIDKPDWFDEGSVKTETILVDVIDTVVKD